jgi:hypothetical protein
MGPFDLFLYIVAGGLGLIVVGVLSLIAFELAKLGLEAWLQRDRNRLANDNAPKPRG